MFNYLQLFSIVSQAVISEPLDSVPSTLLSDGAFKNIISPHSKINICYKIKKISSINILLEKEL